MSARSPRLSPFFAAPPFAVRAQRLIAADADPLFSFLADLENQVLLAGRCVELVRVDEPHAACRGGELRISGPLGFRRAARARVLGSLPPRLIIVRADIGRGTVALVTWNLAARRGTVEVELAAVIYSAALLDRLILRVGGRRRVERRLETTLAALAELAAIVAEFGREIGAAPPSAFEPKLDRPPGYEALDRRDRGE